MYLIDKWSTFQRDEIMYENEGFWNLREDGCGITRYLY